MKNFNSNILFSTPTGKVPNVPLDSSDLLPNVDSDPLTNIYISTPFDTMEADIGGVISNLDTEELMNYYPEDVIPLDTDSDIQLNTNDGDCPDGCTSFYSSEKDEWGCDCPDDSLIDGVAPPSKNAMPPYLYLLPLLFLIK